MSADRDAAFAATPLGMWLARNEGTEDAEAVQEVFAAVIAARELALTVAPSGTKVSMADVIELARFIHDVRNELAAPASPAEGEGTT